MCTSPLLHSYTDTRATWQQHTTSVSRCISRFSLQCLNTGTVDSDDSGVLLPVAQLRAGDCRHAAAVSSCQQLSAAGAVLQNVATLCLCCTAPCRHHPQLPGVSTIPAPPPAASRGGHSVWDIMGESFEDLAGKESWEDLQCFKCVVNNERFLFDLDETNNIAWKNEELKER